MTDTLARYRIEIELNGSSLSFTVDRVTLLEAKEAAHRTAKAFFEIEDTDNVKVSITEEARYQEQEGKLRFNE